MSFLKEEHTTASGQKGYVFYKEDGGTTFEERHELFECRFMDGDDEDREPILRKFLEEQGNQYYRAIGHPGIEHPDLYVYIVPPSLKRWFATLLVSDAIVEEGLAKEPIYTETFYLRWIPDEKPETLATALVRWVKSCFPGLDTSPSYGVSIYEEDDDS